MSHLEEGRLHELLDGEIPSAELPPVQAHLTACAACRARLEEARAFQTGSDRLIEALDVLAPAPRPRAAAAVLPRRMHWARNLAWAASVAAALGVGYVGRGGLPVAAPDSTRADAANASVVAAPAVVNPPASAPRAAAPAAQVVANQLAEREPTQERKAPAGEPNASLDRLQVVEGGRNPNPPVDAPRREFPAAPPATMARMDERASAVGAFSARKSTASAPTVPEQIEFAEALRRLNGSLRLIEGWVADRLELAGGEVRVVYPVANGEIFLAQRLINGRLSFRLVAPPGFPEDSLAKLLAKIRE